LRANDPEVTLVSATKIEKLVREFAENVAAQTDAIRRGDSKTGNKRAKRYIRAFVDGAWRELGQADEWNAETYVADPLSDDPSFMGEYSYDRQRAGFFRWRDSL